MSLCCRFSPRSFSSEAKGLAIRPISLFDVFAARPALLAQELTDDSRLQSVTLDNESCPYVSFNNADVLLTISDQFSATFDQQVNALKRHVMGPVPDRGGRTDNLRPDE